MADPTINIPPIIQNMVDMMKNKKDPIWQRDNAATSLSYVHKVLTKELSDFQKEKNALRTRNSR
jgi:hypothetical protein